jgi:hypothetical protein
MHFVGEENFVDFGTQDYTRRHRAYKKCLILLGFCEWRGNPSLSNLHWNRSLFDASYLEPPLGFVPRLTSHYFSVTPRTVTLGWRGQHP